MPPKRNKKTELTLVALDIEGDWNVPLLQNAAAMSASDLVFARSDHQPGGTNDTGVVSLPLVERLNNFDCLLACETGKRSIDLYDFQAPRGRTALIVGNEERGIPREVLKAVDHVVSIPMCGKGMSSVNVAVASAIGLYVLDRDLARRKNPRPTSIRQGLDLLIQAPEDPSEIGSLLRSAWAFGWRKDYLDDPSGTWFSDDRDKILAGRAAARREKNPVVVKPVRELRLNYYDGFIRCTPKNDGTSLSRFNLLEGRRILVVYGKERLEMPVGKTSVNVSVDHSSLGVEPCFRHEGSILLSVLSQMLAGGRRG